MLKKQQNNMIKLTPDVKQFYVDNSDGVATRRRLGWEITECLTETYHLSHLIKEIKEDFEKLWDVAESYWVLPEENDYVKLIDKVYKRNK